MAGARIYVEVVAVPNATSAQAAGEQMAQAAQSGARRAPPGREPPVMPAFRRAEQEARRVAAERAKLAQGLAFLSAPVTNPTSLWGNLLSGVALQRALSTRRGQQALGNIGMAGPGGTIAATAGIVAGAVAVGLALQGLKKTIQEVMDAIQRATKLYTFKTQSGFSDSYASQRMTAAGVLGVSTDEVMKFGAAMNFLNPRLKQANENFAQSYRRLTLVNWNWKILQTNFESLFTTMAVQAAPALNKMASALSNIVGAVDRFIQRHPNMFQAGVAALLGPGFALGMNGPAGEAPVGPVGQVPKRSSAWEKMGLVIGGPMGGDRTNQLLRAQLNMLHRIHQAIAPRIPQGAAPLNPHYSANANLPRT